MYLLVVYIPLMSALVVGLFGRYLGRLGAGVLASSCIGLTFSLSCLIFLEVGILGNRVNIKVFDWLDSGVLWTNWGFQFDSVTATMLVVVTSISFLVHMYSVGYMWEDPHIVRFMSYLSLFTFFMLCLVTADNFVQMFLGWEGVGLASYLLINFWYTRVQANKAAIKAIIVNRVGDFGLGLAILGIYLIFRSLNFNCVFSMVDRMTDVNIIILGYEVNAVLLISLLLFLGAVGKSAQLGLHTWLPDAMEGPTPVSALIHAATMVTAGVFVLIRCSPLLEYSKEALMVITIVGALTAFFAGTVGMFQNDLKRVIAYSTCSQLGYMVFACGQPFADALKLLVKETVLPSSANRVLFILAPMITLMLSLVGWAAMPVAPGAVISDLNVGLLYIFAVSSLGVYGIILSGWASNSRYAFLGALRSAAQMVSYEVSIGLIVMTVIICAGTLNLSGIVGAQETIWYGVPLFFTLGLFYISVLAETNRAPFDLPEAEAELVAGYFVEYSSMAFALFFLGEYGSMLLMCSLTTVLFLGGWWGLGSSILWFAIKVVFLVFGLIWVRAAFPRYRYDQLMRLGWKVFLPLSLAWVVVTVGFLLLFR